MGVHQKSETERIGKASDRRIIDRKRCPSDELSRVKVPSDRQLRSGKALRFGGGRLSRYRTDGNGERQRFGRHGVFFSSFHHIPVRCVGLIIKTSSVTDSGQNADTVGEASDGPGRISRIPFKQFERTASVRNEKERTISVEVGVVKHSAVLRRQKFDGFRFPIENGNGLDSPAVVGERDKASVRRNRRVKDIDSAVVEERLNGACFKVDSHQPRIRSVRLDGRGRVCVDVRRLKQARVFGNPPRFSAFGAPFKQIGNRMRMTFDSVIGFISGIEDAAAVEKRVVPVGVGQ